VQTEAQELHGIPDEDEPYDSEDRAGERLDNTGNSFVYHHNLTHSTLWTDPRSLHDIVFDLMEERALDSQSESSSDQSHSEPDNPLYDQTTSEPAIESGFVLSVDELKTSVEFIRALESASLDRGNLDAEALTRLWNPPEHVLEVSDPNDLFSLEQYLMTQGSSQDTYIRIHENHNKRYAGDEMLSYEKIKYKSAQWSGIEPIVTDMCPNSCMGYVGPFSNLDTCRICNTNCYNTLVFEQTNGKCKIPAQRL
jgi:hypothetical protein